MILDLETGSSCLVWEAKMILVPTFVSVTSPVRKLVYLLQNKDKSSIICNRFWLILQWIKHSVKIYDTHHSCKRNIHLEHKPLWLQIGAALMYDAIKVLYRALDLLTTMRNVDFKRKVSCDEGYNSLPWFNGKALVNALKTVNLKNIYFKHLYLKLESFWYPLKVVFTPWTNLEDLFYLHFEGNLWRTDGKNSVGQEWRSTELYSWHCESQRKTTL